MIRESRISYRRCLVKQRYFSAVYKYAGKADLGKGYWDIKRKFGVTTHFSEISKLQFGDKMVYIALHFSTFLNSRCLIIYKSKAPVSQLVNADDTSVIEIKTATETSLKAKRNYIFARLCNEK